MVKLMIPVIVEGKYDKARLSSVVDATILTTDGFGIFNNEEKRALIKKLGQRGVVVLCDSDGGGRQIRSHLKGMLDGIKVYDLYTPVIEGKERRKSHRSKAGILGVEGTDSSVLEEIFVRFVAAHPELTGDGNEKKDAAITTAVLYELGLSGTDGASERRAYVCERLGLPKTMTSRAFAEAASMVSGEEEIRKIVGETEKK